MHTSLKLDRTGGSAPLLGALVDGPSLKYLGLSLLLAWHYCLWFVPGVFAGTFLLDDRVTFAWLIALAANGITVLVTALCIGHWRHLPDQSWINWLVTSLACLATLFLTLIAPALPSLIPQLAAAALVGGTSGWLWLAWGERYARSRASFTIGRVGPIFAACLITAMLIALALPSPASAVFVALIPLAAGFLLDRGTRIGRDWGPIQPLPKTAARGGFFAVLFICGSSFVAAFISYFTVAIVPWDNLWHIESSFTLGVLLAAVAVLAISLGVWLLRRAQQKHPGTEAAENRPGDEDSPGRGSAPTIYRLFPWLLVSDVIACCLFLVGPRWQLAGFMVALATSSVFEILLTMYMGTLTLRGYTSPVVGFALSAASIRLGICGGNGLTLVYERVPGLYDPLVNPTMLACIVVLALLLIPLVRLDYRITQLIQPSKSVSELEQIVAATANEFRLSDREAQIMLLLGQACTASVIADRLYISVNTVNTHVQHIYTKLGIHKRGELINYLNKRIEQLT
jgi:DNA-binding CsgD family transcriptional regulator